MSSASLSPASNESSTLLEVEDEGEPRALLWPDPWAELWAEHPEEGPMGVEVEGPPPGGVSRWSESVWKSNLH